MSEGRPSKGGSQASGRLRHPASFRPPVLLTLLLHLSCWLCVRGGRSSDGSRPPVPLGSGLWASPRNGVPGARTFRHRTSPSLGEEWTGESEDDSDDLSEQASSSLPEDLSDQSEESSDTSGSEGMEPEPFPDNENLAEEGLENNPETGNDPGNDESSTEESSEALSSDTQDEMQEEDVPSGPTADVLDESVQDTSEDPESIPEVIPESDIIENDSENTLVSNMPDFYHDTHKLANRYLSAVDRAGRHVDITKAEASSLLSHSQRYAADLNKLSANLHAFKVGVRNFRKLTAQKHQKKTDNLGNALRKGLEDGIKDW